MEKTDSTIIHFGLETVLSTNNSFFPFLIKIICFHP